jgi:hypothetical protein
MTIRVKDLITEEGADELVSSENMRPYMDLYAASMSNRDTKPALEKIRAVPLEKGYVWRVVSAMKWAFADFDSETVKIDQATLSPEDLEKIHKELIFRPLQLYLFLEALFGAEMAKAMMLTAVKGSERDWNGRVELTP